MPWRRPGFELGLQIAALQRRQPRPARRRARRPRADHVGRHVGGVREHLAGGHRRAERFIAEQRRSRSVRPGPARLRAVGRRRSAARVAGELAPVLRGLCSTDRRMVGRLRRPRRRARLPRPRGGVPPRPARHVVPRPLPPHQGPAAAARRAAVGAVDELVTTGSASCTRYRDEYAAYYRRLRRRRRRRRCAAPTRPIVLVPGVGMFSFGADAAEARIAGEFYVNAINVMRGAEALSTLRARSTRPRSSASSTGRSRRRSCSGCPQPKPLTGRVALVTGGRRASARPSPSGSPPRARRWSSPTSTRRRRRGDELGGRSRRVEVDVTDEAAVAAALDEACVRLRRRRHRGEQRRAVDLQAAARDDRPTTGTCSTT